MAQSEPMSIGDVEPGDLLFVEPSGDPVSSLVTRLDHPGRFSHVGVCIEPGVMLSARTQRAYDDARDLGGLRRDPMRGLMEEGRVLHSGRPREAADVERALKEIDSRYLVLEGEGGDTDFSMVKLFLVATALHAFAPEAVPGRDPGPLQEAVFRAAEVWDVSQDHSPEHVAFYCAEFVSLAFGHTFTLGEFKPGAPLDTSTGPVAIDPLALVGPKPTDAEPRMDFAIDDKSRALLDVIVRLYRYDPAFIGGRCRDVWRLLYGTIKGQLGPLADRIARALHGEAPATAKLLPDQPAPPLENSTVIPFALATPRLLETAPWMGDIRPLVR